MREFFTNYAMFNAQLKSKVILVFSLFLFPIFLQGQVINFELVNVPLADVSDGAAIFGDVNNDGYPDIFITGDTDCIAKLYINDGAGNFTENTSNSFAGVFLGSAAFADVNNDGSLDLFIIGTDENFDLIAKLYLNDGAGNFTELLNTPFQGLLYPSIAIGDIDGDGLKEILISGMDFNEDVFVDLYKNNGNNNFAVVNDIPFPSLYGNVAMIDLNGDGYLDVIVNGMDSDGGPISEIFINDGQGNFTGLETDVAAVVFGAMDFADVNGDGNVDLLIVGTNLANYTDVTYIYHNDGNGNFTLAEEVSQAFVPTTNGDAVFVDINGDGFVDVFTSGMVPGMAAEAIVYINDGNGFFTKIEQDLNISEGLYVTLDFADIDGDGMMDLLTSGDLDFIPFTNLYRNRTKAFNVIGEVWDSHGVIKDVEVFLGGRISVTDNDGLFSFKGTFEGTYTLTIDMEGYEPYTQEVVVDESDAVDGVIYIGEIVLVSITTVIPNFAENVTVYPNPFDSQMSISNAHLIDRVVITNMVGQRVAEITLKGESAIATDHLSQGVYVITLHGFNGETSVCRVVKR